jgi:hypothetical protein
MRKVIWWAIGAALGSLAVAGPALPASASAPLAGTCTVTVTYDLRTISELFTDYATYDGCSGGGQAKYQSEVPGNSTASDGYLRINENNPVRTTCWVPGDADVGTCQGKT